MKTIAIFSGYHLPHLGGIERYTDNLSKKLVDKGYKVIIISSDYQFDQNYYKEKNKITFLKIPVLKLFVSRYPIPKINKDYRAVLKKLEEFNIDAIIVNTRFHLTSLVGAKFGKIHNIPVFLVEHGSQHLTVDNKILDFFGAIYEHGLTKYIKRFVNYYYGVSKEASNWQKHFKIKSNGVWYNSITDFSNQYEIKKEKENINICYAGRVLKQKGIVELINSFNELSKTYDNIYLHIAGDGNLLESLKIENKNNHITFYGKLDFNNLCKLYSKTDIFVYAPNWPEGLPTSVLEAGLMNCAVISSPQGGNKEIIVHDENGLMVNNEEELKDALITLIENQSLRKKLARNLKDKILDTFIWDKTADIIINDLKVGIKKYESK